MIAHDWLFPYFLYTLSSLLLLYSHSLVSATLMNITVDDSGSDPLTGLRIAYEPPNTWSFGPDCGVCTAKPDPSQAFMQTWHDVSSLPESLSNTSSVPTASFQFAGTALYVFCILAHTAAHPTGNSDMTFLIDNVPVGVFSQSPTGATNYDFNVPVYANTSIPFGVHTFTLVSGHLQGLASLVLLDYIIYSIDSNTTSLPVQSSGFSTPDSPVASQTSFTASSTAALSTSLSNSSPNSTAGTGAELSGASTSTLSPRDKIIIIVASIVGGLLILASIGLGIFYYRRRHYSDYTAPDTFASGTGQIVDHPGASGWVEGTWGPDADEPLHPSLLGISPFQSELQSHSKAQGSNATSNTLISDYLSADGSVGATAAAQVRPTIDTLASPAKSPVSIGASSGHRTRTTEPDVPSSALSSPLSSGGLSPTISPTIASSYLSPRAAPPVPAPLNRTASEHAFTTVKFQPNRHPDLMRGASASAVVQKGVSRATPEVSTPTALGEAGMELEARDRMSPLPKAQLRPLVPRGARPIGMVVGPDGRRLDVGANSRPPSYEPAERR